MLEMVNILRLLDVKFLNQIFDGIHLSSYLLKKESVIIITIQI